MNTAIDSVKFDSYLRLICWAFKHICDEKDDCRRVALAEAMHELPNMLTLPDDGFEKTFWEYHIGNLSQDMRDEVCTYASEVVSLEPKRYLEFKTLYRL